MPTSMIATISSAVATGRMMNSATGSLRSWMWIAEDSAGLPEPLPPAALLPASGSGRTSFNLAALLQFVLAIGHDDIAGRDSAGDYGQLSCVKPTVTSRTSTVLSDFTTNT